MSYVNLFGEDAQQPEKGAGLKELSENYNCSKMTIWRKIQKEKEKLKKEIVKNSRATASELN